ncbi:MAG: transcription termination factor Rho [Acidimicrobiales bacterium]
MSVDSTELRKSTLQRKDREELTAIATALGAKPSSRARKAEIVDLILETVSDGSEEATEDQGDEHDTEAEPTDVEEPEAAETPSKNGDDGGTDQKAGDQPEVGNRRRRRRGRGGDRDSSSDTWDGEPIPVQGFLDLRDEGYGFLRTNGWVPSKDDAYVPVKMVRQLGLRRGDELTGASRPANQNEKNPAILTIDTVNGTDPAKSSDRPGFDSLTPVLPTSQLVQEVADDPAAMTARVIDIVAPVGRGQRGLVIGPARADGLAVLKAMARSIEANDPDVHIIVLLIDERPEDVIDMKRHLSGGEVQASTFDRPADEHVLVAEMTIERAKRMVEFGADVCVLMNGVTRLARSYDVVAPSSGRNAAPTPVDNWAIYQTKKFLGAARNLEEGGSLTVIGTAISEGSATDQAILDGLADTAGSVLYLDGLAAVRGIEPPVDVVASRTRHLDSLLDDAELGHNAGIRRALADLGDAGLDALLVQLAAVSNNAGLDPAKLG